MISGQNRSSWSFSESSGYILKLCRSVGDTTEAMAKLVGSFGPWKWKEQEIRGLEQEKMKKNEAKKDGMVVKLSHGTHMYMYIYIYTLNIYIQVYIYTLQVQRFSKTRSFVKDQVLLDLFVRLKFSHLPTSLALTTCYNHLSPGKLGPWRFTVLSR